uniref:O-fucosyltransferase family protein n=1 Tax=Oryza glumipatula TaxID=40148 RepID=A0A0E0AA38_9ORYZ
MSEIPLQAVCLPFPAQGHITAMMKPPLAPSPCAHHLDQQDEGCWGKSYPGKRFVYKERRLIGKFPLIPEEVGLILRAMGFDNTTMIYLA